MRLTVLKNIVEFTGLGLDVPVSLPHGLNVNDIDVAPQLGGTDVEGFTVTADAINITVTRTIDAPGGAVKVYVEHWHTIEAALQKPAELAGLTPFFFAASGGANSAEIISINSALFVFGVQLAAQTAALNGDMVLSIQVPNPEIVSAADLNAAAAGTFKRTFTGALRTSTGALLDWAAFTPVLVPGEVVVDPDVGVPVITGTPKFVAGFVVVEITFDTDAGATKTYAINDTITVEVKVSATNQLLGWPVASVTKTFIVVA